MTALIVSIRYCVSCIMSLCRCQLVTPGWLMSNAYLQELFINRSAPHIAEEFSLHRTYIVFRTLGLRHLTVVDMANRVVGIITRKDLMGFNLEEKLEQRRRRGYSVDGGTLRLLPSERIKRLTSSSSLTVSLTAVDGAV